MLSSYRIGMHVSIRSSTNVEETPKMAHDHFFFLCFLFFTYFRRFQSQYNFTIHIARMQYTMWIFTFTKRLLFFCSHQDCRAVVFLTSWQHSRASRLCGKCVYMWESKKYVMCVQFHEFYTLSRSAIKKSITKDLFHSLLDARRDSWLMSINCMMLYCIFISCARVTK